MIERMRSMFDNEPVRVMVHGMGLLVVGYLVASGKMDADMETLVKGLLGYLLVVGAPAELVRRKVSPVVK